MKIISLITLISFSLPSLILGASFSIPGTGDSTKVLRELCEDYSKSTKGFNCNVPDSVGSKGGIRLLDNDNAIIARVAGNSSKYKSLGYYYFEYAISPVALVINKSVSKIKNLSQQKTIELFKGENRNWKHFGGNDQKIYIVGREEGDSSREIIKEFLPDFVQGDEGKVYVAYSVAEAAELVRTYPNTITYLPYSEIPDNAKAIDFSTRNPYLYIIGKEDYHLKSPQGLVFKDNKNLAIRSFLKYLRSKHAKSIIKRNGMRPTD